MYYTIDRFEDAGLAVLETDAGERLEIPRETLPPEAKEGDVLVRLPWYRWHGTLRYTAEPEATTQRRREAAALRASLPQVDEEGDLEL